MLKAIDALMQKHGKALLCFSAGKDSLACLELLRPWWGKLTVGWVDAGASHPKTHQYMEGIARMVPDFVRIEGNQPQVIREFGWPADVVPVRGTLAGSYGAGKRMATFQPYTDCCARSMWGPLSSYIGASGHNLIILGQRKEESLRNRSRDETLQTINGVTYLQPLNDWTEAQVWEYLEKVNAPIPPFYGEGAESSGDCWNCTAYLDHNQGRLAAMARKEPERYAVVEMVLTELQSQLTADMAPLGKILRN